jgi:hypothetical protein
MELNKVTMKSARRKQVGLLLIVQLDGLLIIVFLRVCDIVLLHSSVPESSSAG